MGPSHDAKDSHESYDQHIGRQQGYKTTLFFETLLPFECNQV
jgi:hypothetical protein